MPNYNTGEIDELKAKLALIYWRDNNLNGIFSVGLTHEYKSHGIHISKLKQLNDNDIIALSISCGSSKSKASFKADVLINGIAYSLKSHRNALPALLNHTHRDGIIKVCTRIGLDINRLDKLINEYWKLRLAGIYREDVKYSGSVFQMDEDAMTKLLQYFLFTGSARGNSEYPAEYLYEFSDPFEFSNWLLRDSIDAARAILQATTISIRSKAMPASYSDNSTAPAHLNIKPWTKMHQGAYRGTIHIRG